MEASITRHSAALAFRTEKAKVAPQILLTNTSEKTMRPNSTPGQKFQLTRDTLQNLVSQLNRQIEIAKQKSDSEVIPYLTDLQKKLKKKTAKADKAFTDYVQIQVQQHDRLTFLNKLKTEIVTLNQTIATMLDTAKKSVQQQTKHVLAQQENEAQLAFAGAIKPTDEEPAAELKTSVEPTSEEPAAEAEACKTSLAKLKEIRKQDHSAINDLFDKLLKQFDTLEAQQGSAVELKEIVDLAYLRLTTPPSHTDYTTNHDNFTTKARALQEKPSPLMRGIGCSMLALGIAVMALGIVFAPVGIAGIALAAVVGVATAGFGCRLFSHSYSTKAEISRTMLSIEDKALADQNPYSPVTSQSV